MRGNAKHVSDHSDDKYKSSNDHFEYGYSHSIVQLTSFFWKNCEKVLLFLPISFLDFHLYLRLAFSDCNIIRKFLSVTSKIYILTHLAYIANAKKLCYMKQQSHSFESVRNGHTSWRQLPLQNDVNHGIRQCYIILTLERRYKYM